MNKIVFLLMFIFLTGTVITVHAAGEVSATEVVQVQAPRLAKGETWVWSDRSETCLGEQAGDWLFSVEGGSFSGERLRNSDLNLLRDARGKEVLNVHNPHAGLLSFPLYVGKEWGQEYMRKRFKRSQRFKVESYEEVKTKGGSFSAFRISGIDRRLDSGFGHQVTIWYAPSVKNIVKMTGEDETTHTTIEGWNYELIEYRKSQ